MNWEFEQTERRWKKRRVQFLCSHRQFTPSKTTVAEVYASTTVMG